MTFDLLAELQPHEGLTRTDFLVSRGHSTRSIGRAIEKGTLLRVCQGWVATRDASQLSIIAVANRGKLSGSTALYSRGTWDGVSGRISIQRAPNSHGAVRRLAVPIAGFIPPRHPKRGVDTAWRIERWIDPAEPPWRVSVIDALLDIASRATTNQFVACLESAVHEGTLSRAAIPTLFSFLPQRLQHLVAELDFGAGSGLESLTRVGLKPHVQSIETQVAIPGIARSGSWGWVDLLLDKWLVIELDGDEWHDPVADRLRNQLLVQQGYRWHRFGYDQVINRWADVEATVLELLKFPPRGV